jgi:hypothetical protein
MTSMTDDLEKAYGLLWSALGDDPRVREARDILDAQLSEDGKQRGREYAFSQHPSADEPAGKNRPMLGMTALIFCGDDKKTDEARVALLGAGCRVRRASTENDFRRHLAVYTPTLVLGKELQVAQE